MQILSAAQLRQVDQETIRKQGISSWQLMERAASALFDALKSNFDLAEEHFTIFCGKGNNGGDGLALARMLYQSGSEIKVYLIHSESYSEDNLINQKKLNSVSIHRINPHENIEIKKGNIIIDALFGYGLNRPPDDSWGKLINRINDSGNKIISVDIPSGLLADSPTPSDAPVIKAKTVYTFHSPKQILLLPGSAKYVDDFKILDISLEPSESSNYFFLQKEYIQSLIKPVSKFSHKGTFGHAMIIGGSEGKAGAVILSVKAALKAGCGLVTAFIPKSNMTPIQSAFFEAMALVDRKSGFITNISINPHSYKAIGIGPGMGTHKETKLALENFLKKKFKTPLVIDADALNILSEGKQLLKYLPGNTILTPHPKELERLIGEWNNDFEKIEKVKSFSAKYKLIIVLKGAHTSIFHPDTKIFYNSTGNYGMATAGSGDVLTGMIASLLAQSYSPVEAAIMGVYLHGLAGDLAAKKTHPKSMIASDIITNLDEAWQALNPY